MDIIISKDEIIEYEKLKVISETTLIKEKINLFENKYRCSLDDFKKKIDSSDEDFEEWDDYIEWKANSDILRDLEKKLINLDNAKNIKVV